MTKQQIDVQAVLNTFKDDLKRLRSITADCRDDMHEPDEQGVTAKVIGKVLDNAFGCTPVKTSDLLCLNHNELMVVLRNGSRYEFFNLANLIALARVAGEMDVELWNVERAKVWAQPNGIPAEQVHSLIALKDPSNYMTGTLFQTPGALWRVAEMKGPQFNHGERQFIRMTKRDGTLKQGESRWAVEVVR